MIVVEGYMDVVALAQFGVRNAVATLGTSVGSAHMDRIFRHVSQVVFCFDGGRRRTGCGPASTAMPACRHARRTPGTISCSSLRVKTRTPIRSEGAEGFRQRTVNAKTLSDFVFELAGEGLDLSTTDHKACMPTKPALHTAIAQGLAAIRTGSAPCR
ncbi:MAG: toprim domain-containing protein [Porticoccaceae bacterium]